MEKTPKDYEIADEDLRAALREMGTYVDITEDDLKKIYEIAFRHAERRLAARFLVRDVMTKDVIKVGEDADLDEVANLLSENRISGLPVVDGEDRVIGVVTEADIRTVATILDEKRIKRLPVVNERGRLIGVISRADIVRASGTK